MDEITLTEAAWAWKIQNFTFNFRAISGSSKIITYKNIQIHVRGSISIVNWFFSLNARLYSIRISNNWNYQNTANYLQTIP